MSKSKTRKRMTMAQALALVKKQPSVSIPVAGKALADLSRNASYNAAAAGTLGVTIFETGNLKKRVTSISILQRLGLAAANSSRAA